MIPHQGRAIDTINFRNVKESASSVDLGNSNAKTNSVGTSRLGGGVSKDGLMGAPSTGLKGVPLDSGLATPAGEMVDPFEEFNSVTLHHDDDEGGR